MKANEFVRENYGSMNKYGIYTTKSKDGDFELWQHDKHLGSFKTIQDLDAYLQDYLDGSSSLRDDKDDKPTDKEIRQAKGIAFDKRYRDGNYTGASNTIDKLKKGLSSHPDVADALKRANEDLKFQNKFKVGEKIKAYDFQPMPDRDDRYVVGTIIKVDAQSISQPGALGYHIKVEQDEPSGRRVGQTIFVPYETEHDHDNRVSVAEGMGFHVAKSEKRDDGTYWNPVLDSGDRYEPDAYKRDWPANKMPKDNPDHKPEWDIHLSNHNAREVMGTLGYPTDLEDQSPFPVDEFIGRTTQWLQKSIGKPSPAEPTTVDRSGGGATMYSGGKDEGYFNRVIKGLNKMARDGKAAGGTHVYFA